VELRARLNELDLLPKEEPEEAMMEAPPLEEEETPFVVARPEAGPAPAAEAPVEEVEAPAVGKGPPAEKEEKKEPVGEVELAVPEAGELPEWQRKLLRLKEVVAEEGEEEGEG